MASYSFLSYTDQSSRYIKRPKDRLLRPSQVNVHISYCLSLSIGKYDMSYIYHVPSYVDSPTYNVVKLFVQYESLLDDTGTRDTIQRLCAEDLSE
jgi:hypothetical protein